MGLQWTLVASFLYAEIFIVLILVLPIVSPSRWNRLFKSTFLNSIRIQASWYFFVILGVLVLLNLDAIREIHKYSNETTDHAHLDTQLQVNMKLFRAQRNFYISGISLLLSFIIRRLVVLTSTVATLLAETEASMKQAQSATNVAKNLLHMTGESAQNDKNEVQDKIVAELKARIIELEEAKLELENELKREKKIDSTEQLWDQKQEAQFAQTVKTEEEKKSD